jgi:UDP-N-acetylmuramoyl-tripeptide--D-alanyl-D-alanine ligase
MRKFLTQFFLFYIRMFAKLQLFKIRPLVIGITGSAGKTSAMEAIYAILKPQFKVKIGRKANSETGIPLNILDITPTNFSITEWLIILLLCPIKILTNWKKYEVYLVEMGIDDPKPPKNMEYLLKIVKPNIAVFLNATPMHSEPFDYLVKTTDENKRASEITKLIANEKGKIVTTLDSNQTAILNFDQKELVDLIPSIKARLVGFGKSNDSLVRIDGYKLNKNSTEFHYLVGDYNLLSEQAIVIKIDSFLLPQHFAYTFAATIAVGISLKLDLKTIKNNLETKFSLPPGRSAIIPGVNDSLIIDSSYNASTKPMLDMLDLLKNIPAKRKIALLGDMREMGKVAKFEHEKVAFKAVQVCDLVALVGPQMKEFALPVIEKTNTPVHWFKNAYQASDYLKKQLKKDDIILIKGSQNTLLLEIAVEKLMANPNLANQLLARRSKFWDKKRLELKDA